MSDKKHVRFMSPLEHYKKGDEATKKGNSVNGMEKKSGPPKRASTVPKPHSDLKGTSPGWHEAYGPSFVRIYEKELFSRFSNKISDKMGKSQKSTPSMSKETSGRENDMLSISKKH